MNRKKILFWMAVYFLGASFCAADDHDNDKNNDGKRGAPARSATSGRKASTARVNRTAPTRRPVLIRMNSSGNRYQTGQKPSYGRTQWNRKAQPRQQSVPRPDQGFRAVPPANKAGVPGVRSAAVVHHHAYSEGYIREKLAKIGVKSEPGYITDRSEIVSTDRAHSIIGNPSKGPQGEAFRGSLVSPRKFNGNLVRDRMALVNQPDYMRRIDRENADETRRNHVYWHGEAGAGYSYAHYLDDSGYHWYGWYADDQFFWTRNYNGRWWWYDTGYNRWCFYNDNYWWWQDPYHVGDLYVYDGDSYIPANSAEDPVVVTGREQSDDAAYNSPDGMRTVRIARDSGDAFLYDNADPPTFNPVYLASGVQGIQFSGANNGRRLEIILKINDGSYDMFDAQGVPYNADTPPADN